MSFRYPTKESAVSHQQQIFARTDSLSPENFHPYTPRASVSKPESYVFEEMVYFRDSFDAAPSDFFLLGCMKNRRINGQYEMEDE
jgi:hypothetical protein